MTGAPSSALPSVLPGAADTIVAQATAPGRAALTVLRVSGPRAHEICRAVVVRFPALARKAVLSPLRDATGATLDRAIVIRYDAPASFTGEDAVELSTHGGAVVPATVMAALIARGARQAGPGEFTRRALLNGKLDVLQAEATADLIAAGSRSAQRVALRQLDGGLSRRILALREGVLEIEALIAYEIDFPEEDEGPIPPERTLAALDRAEASLRALLATASSGELVREGALVVLAGAPNVGKSSLFNAMIGRSRAIVTEIPGTTRDALEAVIDAEPWPLRLVDTAGLRRTSDPVERLGIEVSEDYLRRAAVVLVCGDSASALRDAAQAVRAVLPAGDAHDHHLVLVRTKCDLDHGRERESFADVAAAFNATDCAETSAESGAGVRSLVDTIGGVLSRRLGAPDFDAPVLTQARHRFAVERALRELQAFRRAWREEALPATIAAVHLRAAAGALEELIGKVDVEDILDEVFRRFCIGK